MGMYSITGWSGGGRRPLTYNLKAGQFRGMGRVNVYPSKTTIVNNNFIGGGYGMYNNYECCNNSTPKWLNWMMGIGIGTSLLGGILNLFGIGNNNGAGTVEGAGGKEEPQTRTETETTDPTQSKEYKDLKAQHEKDLAEIAKLKEQAAAYQAQQAQALNPIEEEVPEVEATPEDIAVAPEQDYSNIKNGAKMVCTDASGKTQDISGTLSNVQTDANGVPQSFTLTDDTSKNQYKYEVRVGSDGTLTYECVSKNGNETIGAPTYTLKDGKLVNENGQNGFGQGIRTKEANPTPQNRNNQQKLSYEAEQYFNEHPYTIKDYGGRKVYVSEDGKLMANSEQQLWNMIENNNNIAKTKTPTTNNTNNTKAKINYNINSGLLRSNGSGQVTVNGKTYTFKPDRSFDNKEALQEYIKNGLLTQIKKDNPNFNGELD